MTTLEPKSTSLLSRLILREPDRNGQIPSGKVSNIGPKSKHMLKLEMCPLEHEWPATYKVEAPLRVGFLEISRYSRHLSRAEPELGCVYHHTIQR